MTSKRCSKLCGGLVVGLVYAAAGWPTLLVAQVPAPTPSPASPAAPAAVPPAAREARVREDQARTILLFVGQTRLIDAPWPVRRVSVNDPVVADVDVGDPRRVQVQGKAPGVAEIVLWSDTGETWRAHIEVEADPRRLQAQLLKIFPKSTLEVQQLGGVVVIKGMLNRAEQVQQLRRFLELSNLEYVDATTLAGVQQVQLQVKVAEVSRSALRALGVNTFFGGSDFFGGVQIGSSAGPLVQMPVGVAAGASASGNLPFTFVNDMTVPPSATLFAGFPNADLQVFMQALAENQYLRVLAEPTLVSQSGQDASFLVGGEFPIPIAQLGGGGTTQISIEYKEFGVRLKFRPVVMGDGSINLRVMPEVSELSDVGAVEVLGTRVPSVLTRRVETTLELQSGQTFAIAGLINRTANAQVAKVPGLGDVPVLGALFRSVRYNQSETEMLVLVTASLVEPSSSLLQSPLPGTNHEPPNAWELFGLGSLEGRSKTPPAQAEQLKRLGLNQLRGPGGWVTYESASNRLAGDGGSTGPR